MIPVSVLDRFQLDGRTAILTGVGPGVGEHVAKAYAELGANVVAVGVLGLKHFEHFPARQGGTVHQVDRRHRRDGQDPLDAVSGDVGGRCGLALWCGHGDAFPAER